MTPAAIDLDLLERRDACMREISPSPLTSKASSVGSHYDPLPCGLKKQGMNFTFPQLVDGKGQCVFEVCAQLALLGEAAIVRPL